MKFIPLIVQTRDRTAADGGSVYCNLNGHVEVLDYCERCQFHVKIEKQGAWYGVQCSFAKEAPCMHDGCEEQGQFVHLWDHDEDRYIYEYYCAEHAQEHGYCYMCGNFWSGCEDFDFAPSGMCSNCRGEYLEGGHDVVDEYYHEPPC